MQLYIIYQDLDDELITYLNWYRSYDSDYDRVFIINHSPKLKIMMPELAGELKDKRLTIVDSKGKVYLDHKAWIMSLYSLKKYREWSYFFARTGNRHLVENVALKLSTSCFAIGELINQEIKRKVEV